jgi:hypothetical protein
MSHNIRVLVTGGRNYDNVKRVENVLDICHIRFPDLQIIQGGAKGADFIAKSWAQKRNVSCVTYNADLKLGKKAGILRNITMLDEGNPDIVLAFPGGTGTKHMIEISKKKGIKTFIFNE